MHVVNNGMLGSHLCSGCDSEVKLISDDIKYPPVLGRNAAYWDCPVCYTSNKLVRSVMRDGCLHYD